MRSLVIIISIVSAVIFIACNKGGYGPPEDNGPHVINPSDTTAPTIDIYTPTDAQVFASGNAINITGKVVDSGGLYRGSIRVIDDANGNVLKDQPYEIHSVVSYNYAISYTPSVSSVSNYTVKVSFEDHGLNVTTKTVKVKINP
ncbi:MAG TPA: hypothetical protein VHM26_18055 [Chitinophagaceae bacterium]|jgi:hypothetical protein|nr:hypothetical protein [Chitinophagaceae bacterium]